MKGNQIMVQFVTMFATINSSQLQIIQILIYYLHALKDTCTFYTEENKALQGKKNGEDFIESGTFKNRTS